MKKLYGVWKLSDAISPYLFTEGSHKIVYWYPSSPLWFGIKKVGTSLYDLLFRVLSVRRMHSICVIFSGSNIDLASLILIADVNPRQNIFWTIYLISFFEPIPFFLYPIFFLINYLISGLRLISYFHNFEFVHEIVRFVCQSACQFVQHGSEAGYTAEQQIASTDTQNPHSQ